MQPTDLLETSLVESGGPLDLNSFPDDEEDDEDPAEGVRYTRTSVVTETLSQVTTEAYAPAKDPTPSTTGGTKAGKKAPWKQLKPKNRPIPGIGALNYTPSEKDIP